MKTGLKNALLGIGLGLLAAMPVGADYDAGQAAYDVSDYATALREWKRLAEQGNAPAQNSLGRMYHKGEGVPQDYAEAAKWYRLAAEQGYAGAQFNLGDLYFLGRGVPQDGAEAMKWFLHAAEQGHAEAQEVLRLLQEFGDMMRDMLRD